MLAVVVLGAGCRREGAPSTAEGCPDLSGQYAVPPEGGGLMFAEGPFASMRAGDWLLSPTGAAGVVVERAGADAFRFRWIFDDATMTRAYAWFREAHPREYAAWYRHRTGGAPLPAEAASHVPPTEYTVTIVRDEHYACRAGHVVMGALSLYVRDGALVGERTHVTGPRVSVWCGDACQRVTLPTGTAVERVRWPTGAVVPWSAPVERMERPQADIAAERAEWERDRAVAAARTFAPADVIQRRIQALATPGTQVASVSFEGGYRVWVEFVAPAGHEPWLLQAVDRANGTARGPEHVETTTDGSGTTRTRFTLERSPVVAPEAVAAEAGAQAPTGDLLPIGDR